MWMPPKCSTISTHQKVALSQHLLSEQSPEESRCSADRFLPEGKQKSWLWKDIARQDTQSSLLSAKRLKSNPQGQWQKALMTKLTFVTVLPWPYCPLKQCLVLKDTGRLCCTKGFNMQKPLTYWSTTSRNAKMQLSAEL